MSMLSSMCERLRQTADEVERIADKNAVRLGLDAIALRYAVEELRDAADTIDGLRTRCQEAQAENTRLRDELAKWERLAAGIDLPKYPVTQFKPKDLERENAKLKELVRELYEDQCDECDRWKYRDRMYELGIEVSE